MPGASGASSSPGEPAGASASGRPSARSIAARGSRPAAAASARRGRRRSSNSTPTGVGPPSMMRSMRPREIGLHVRGRGRRHMAGAVGRRRDHRLAERREDVAGDRRGRERAPRWCRDRRSPDRRPGSRPPWAAPASAAPARTPRRAARASASKRASRARRREVGDVGDQRIERRPALGLVEPRDGARRGRVGAEAVDGLGREGDQAAGGKDARRVRNRGGVGPRRTRVASGAVIITLRDSIAKTAAACSPADRGLYKRRDLCRSVAQSGSAPRSGRGGRRFKSCHSDQYLARSEAPTGTETGVSDTARPSRNPPASGSDAPSRRNCPFDGAAGNLRRRSRQRRMT